LVSRSGQTLTEETDRMLRLIGVLLLVAGIAGLAAGKK
jgi:uncharacterized protein YjeT (DUF2065 family)